jgi:multiple sugar transport system permease protein
MAAKRKAWHVLRVCCIWLSVLVIVFPIYWMFLTSIRTLDESLSFPPRFLPLQGLTLRNYQSVLSGQIGGAKEAYGVVTWFKNSMIVSSIVTIFILLLASAGGYSLARLRFPGKNFLTRFMFIMYLTPGLVLVISLFVLSVKLRLNNKLIGLVVFESGLGLPMALWLARAFFESLPVEVEEAALIDGCSRWGVIGRVVFPMALPGMVVVGFNAFLGSWNSYLLASVLIDNNALKTLPVGLYIFFQRDMGIIWGEMMAAGVISSLPVFLLATYFQRYLIGGMTLGAVKG